MKVIVRKKSNDIPVRIQTEFIKLESAMKLANIVPTGGSAKAEIHVSRFLCIVYFLFLTSDLLFGLILFRSSSMCRTCFHPDRMRRSCRPVSGISAW